MGSGRGRFNSRFAAVMAMAGSAIGLGNIWRFPYMVGEHGGAAFIIVYIACSVIISLPVFLSESVIGKNTRTDTFGALKKAAPKIGWAGIIIVVTAFVITSFYSVVGGWSVDYLWRSVSTGFSSLSEQAASEVFSQMTTSVWEPILCLTIFLGLSAAVVSLGVDKGIGLFSKITMPLLFVMIVLIVVRSVSLPGAAAGIEYLVKPDFAALDGPAIAGALGQSFFSLSLGVGAILTYSSYMKEEENILAAGGWTLLFDTAFAILAGFAIMPAVFAAGIKPTAGPSLVYETLPVIFTQMGKAVPIIFFFSILIAALSSSISMMEVCVCYLVDQKKMRRPAAVALITVGALALGSLCVVVPRVFDTCDFVSSNVLMTVGSLIFVLVVGWFMPKNVVRDSITDSGHHRFGTRVFPFFYFFIKWLAPLGIVAIAVTNLL